MPQQRRQEDQQDKRRPPEEVLPEGGDEGDGPDTPTQDAPAPIGIVEAALLKYGSTVVRVAPGQSVEAAFNAKRDDLGIPATEAVVYCSYDAAVEEKKGAGSGKSRKVAATHKTRAGEVIEAVPEQHGMKGIRP